MNPPRAGPPDERGPARDHQPNPSAAPPHTPQRGPAPGLSFSLSLSLAQTSKNGHRPSSLRSFPPRHLCTCCTAARRRHTATLPRHSLTDKSRSLPPPVPPRLPRFRLSRRRRRQTHLNPGYQARRRRARGRTCYGPVVHGEGGRAAK